MAVGDDASAAGYQLVPSTGVEEARARWGAREINRTRDYIAQLKTLLALPLAVTKGGTGGITAAEGRTNLGLKGAITMSDQPPPVDGVDGDIHFKYTP